MSRRLEISSAVGPANPWHWWPPGTNYQHGLPIEQSVPMPDAGRRQRRYLGPAWLLSWPRSLLGARRRRRQTVGRIQHRRHEQSEAVTPHHWHRTARECDDEVSCSGHGRGLEQPSVHLRHGRMAYQRAVHRARSSVDRSPCSQRRVPSFLLPELAQCPASRRSMEASTFRASQRGRWELQATKQPHLKAV